MKKLLKLFTAFAFTLVTVLSLAGCGNDSITLLDENLVEDNYDNYYEIFVYSYNDTDGDGYGDLNGVTEKLDYIRDLGYTGIWLMPISPSPSYHGYDVTDYTGINQKYGTMEDYDNLLSEAHKRGMKVIIDLVVNHTSSQHEWFQKALAYKQGKPGSEAKYANYYNWSKSQEDGYNKNGNLYYESWFGGDMPDLNLDNENVRDEIENIMKFWLEKGTDGFRLDACLYYYYTEGTKSVEFCTWLKETASKYNENVYIVGETWAASSTIADFYTSGIDSFFCFPASQGGYVATSVNTRSAANYWSSMGYVNNMAGEYIPAPFLGNHDTGRIAGYMGREEDKIKFAYGLLSMYSGNIFAYYGDEIGMLGSQNDPDKRIAMKWDNDFTNATRVPPGSSTQEYVFDGVAEQLKDSGSILNYYKLCNNARNAFPSIMRGTPAKIDTGDKDVLAFTKTWQDETVTIVINFAEESKTVSLGGTLVQGICVSGSVKQSGESLTVPSFGIAILT